MARAQQAQREAEDAIIAAGGVGAAALVEDRRRHTWAAPGAGGGGLLAGLLVAWPPRRAAVASKPSATSSVPSMRWRACRGPVSAPRAMTPMPSGCCHARVFVLPAGGAAASFGDGQALRNVLFWLERALPPAVLAAAKAASGGGGAHAGAPRLPRTSAGVLCSAFGW
jgi:hypothetical protein